MAENTKTGLEGLFESTCMTIWNSLVEEGMTICKTHWGDLSESQREQIRAAVVNGTDHMKDHANRAGWGGAGVFFRELVR